MAANDFFNRWARKTGPASDSDSGKLDPSDPPSVSEPAKQSTDVFPEQPRPVPTIDDVEHLTTESDYTAFMAKGVDEEVRRSAMKKLFTDPHFNIMDGLDIYIDDYSKPDPIPPAMLAMLQHAKSLLDPLKHLESPTMRMVGAADQTTPPGDAADAEQPDPEGQAQSADEPAATVADQDLPQTEAMPAGTDLDSTADIPPADEPATQEQAAPSGQPVDQQPRQS